MPSRWRASPKSMAAAMWKWWQCETCRSIYPVEKWLHCWVRAARENLPCSRSVGLINTPTSGKITIGHDLVMDGPTAKGEFTIIPSKIYRLCFTESQFNPISHRVGKCAGCPGDQRHFGTTCSAQDHGVVGVSGCSPSGKQFALHALRRRTAAGRRGSRSGQ